MYHVHTGRNKGVIILDFNNMVKRKSNNNYTKKVTNNYNRQSDAGDISKKFMQGLGYVHKIGGVGLDLLAIGGVMLLFLLFLRSALDGISFGIVLVIDIVMMAVGSGNITSRKRNFWR